MATKAKPTFTVYFDIPKVQVSLPVQAETFEAALSLARSYTSHKLLYDKEREITDYEKAEINGIYKV